LVVALGLLVPLFEEEARHRGEAGAPEWSRAAIVEHIIENTLYGIDLDPRAVQIAAAALQLMGARGLLEAAQDAIVRALSAPAAAVTVALDEDARAASGRVLPL
jgi:hypothetical protein